MRKVISISSTIVFSVLILFSCGQQQSDEMDANAMDTEQNAEAVELDPNASPENVMNTMFNAAKTGEVGVLKFLLPPYDEESGEIPCDGDCKAICNPGNESMKEELGGNYVGIDDFKTYFSKGKIIGSPSISGDEAAVNFVFGPNLERNETMNMQRIDGKWYLSSF